jgi:hypothetical protein
MTINYADISAPADATKVTEWDRIFDNDILHRFFYRTQRGDVEINGYQNPDGTVRRFIQVDGREFDAASARLLARALLAAADELDGLTQ